MNQLASEIISMVGSESNITFKPLPGDDPKDREPDISRAEDLLGWKPKISRSIGLQNTIEYFQSSALR
jgi:dTDP-glucose 4,6-dehydratase